MRTILFALLAVIIGAGLGAVTALHKSGQLGGDTLSYADVNVDGWLSDWAIGAEAAGPYLRARIARHGLLALAKEEAVYFTRTRDAEGRQLTSGCTYEMTGGTQDAFWWSITLYDGASRLPMNEDMALSVDATALQATPDDWRVLIAPERPEPGTPWLSSRNAGNFDLTLRVYRPSQALLDAPETVLNAPSIRRLSCEAEAAS